MFPVKFYCNHTSDQFYMTICDAVFSWVKDDDDEEFGLYRSMTINAEYCKRNLIGCSEHTIPTKMAADCLEVVLDYIRGIYGRVTYY